MRTIGIQQLMSASLYRDDAMLDSLIVSLTRQHVEQAGRTLIGEPRVAYHFGQLTHADDCGRELMLSDDPDAPVMMRGECVDECAIVDCDEDAATVVMMRVEVDVEGEAGEPSA